MEQWKIYAYLDKTREKRRVEGLSSTSLAKAEVKRKEDSIKRLGQRKKNLAWSEKVTVKEEREKRREKKAKKRAWLKTDTGKFAESEQANLADHGEEWEELAMEERLAKKRKKGLLSGEDDGLADL